MEITFCNKRALVTGASRGIGRDIALQLSKCGAKVTAVARNEKLLEELKEKDASIEVISVDLTDWKATNDALANIGLIDLLVNNVGIVIQKPFGQYEENEIDYLFNINVKSVMNVTQIVTKKLLARKAPGVIVNVSSRTSKVGLEKMIVYGSTKGALDAFTRGIAVELGPHNIRVNCVNPASIMTDARKDDFSDPKVVEELKQRIPLRRLGHVRDVTNAVLFLLSDKASMITGETLLIDGGYVAA